MRERYGEDLAYIHDVGFGDYALGSATGILELLARTGIREGLVVDLAAGAGYGQESSWRPAMALSG